MENYEELSIAFKEMLKRIKIMWDRLKHLRKTMNKNTNKSFMNSDEYAKMRTEKECICASETYLNVDRTRTIIMLKICLYKQRVEKIQWSRIHEKVDTTSGIDSTNKPTNETELTNQESSKFFSGITFRWNDESTGMHDILVFSVFLLKYYKLRETEKTKCKMRRI